MCSGAHASQNTGPLWCGLTIAAHPSSSMYSASHFAAADGDIDRCSERFEPLCRNAFLANDSLLKVKSGSVVPERRLAKFRPRMRASVLSPSNMRALSLRMCLSGSYLRFASKSVVEHMVAGRSTWYNQSLRAGCSRQLDQACQSGISDIALRFFIPCMRQLTT